MAIYEDSETMGRKALAAIYNLSDRAGERDAFSNRAVIDEIRRTAASGIEVPEVDHSLHGVLERYTVPDIEVDPLVLYFNGRHHEPEWKGRGRAFTRFYWANLYRREAILDELGNQDVLFGRRAA
jgi:hypothetical protein